MNAVVECPDCHGRPAEPRHRVEGGSLSCEHCNRTFTFNFMRDGGPFRCSCRAAREAACPTCLGEGTIPAPPGIDVDRELRRAVAEHQRAVARAWPRDHPHRVRCEQLADDLDPPLWVEDILEGKAFR